MKEIQNCASARRVIVIALIAFLFLLTVFCAPTLAAGDTGLVKTQLIFTKRFDINAFLRNPPVYDGIEAIEVNKNRPLFTSGEIAQPPIVSYSPLDELGRCGTAMGLLGPDTIPQEKRGMIGDVRPSGWHNVRYDDRIEDRYLYNRCHLIGYQLAGNNADPQNLITGTRYMNMSGMLPYENKVYSYITETQNHVLYRVRPVFVGDNLVASGVLMEAYSLEDQGQGLSFCVYVHNIQPGVVIDYRTGESKADDNWGEPDPAEDRSPEDRSPEGPKNELLLLPDIDESVSSSDRSIEELDSSTEPTYILNTGTKRFHYPSCPSVQETKEKNKKDFFGTREDAIGLGYIPCGRCNP